MGGKSSSSQKQSNLSAQSNLEGNEATAFGSTNAGGNVHIEALDANAIGSAFDFAKESQAFFGDSYSKTLGLLEENTQDAIYGVQAAYANKESEGTMPLLIVGGILAALGLTIYAFKG